MRFATFTPCALALAGLLVGCGAAAPTQELLNAREAYAKAEAGPAQQETPDRLLTAKQALERAEAVQDDDPGSSRAKTLAYIADRKARLAEAHANIALEVRRMEEAEKQYERALERANRATRERLGETKEQLAERERALAERERKIENLGQQVDKLDEEITKERQARAELEAKLAAAIKSLEEVAKIKEDARGTVITMSGAVLFGTGRSDLLPIAKEQLTKVAQALEDLDETQTIVVEGHTDSRGGSRVNQELSRSRADAVRVYMISQGVPTERITAIGKGEDQPVASNRTSEGRALNRRVEIVISKPKDPA